MKKTLSLVCGLLIYCCSCAHSAQNTQSSQSAASSQSENFTIKQDLNWLTQQLTTDMTVDSVMIKTDTKTTMYRAGEFTYQAGILQLAVSSQTPGLAVYNIFVSSPRYKGKVRDVYFIIEPGNIEIAAEGNSVYAAKGTPLNDDYFAFLQRLEEAASSKVIVYEDAIKDIFKEYTTKHAADASAALYLTDRVMMNDLPANLWLKAFEQSNSAVQNHPAVQKAKTKVEVVSRTAEGQPFVDFTATYNGKEQHLSDYVGKGKYVLVDFWASWCGPCKQEIPNLIAVYNKYKGDKFEVIGVATWDKPEDTLKSIEALGVNYPQIMNAQREGSDAYGITGIPQIILFGPDGTILKRDLRGAQIEETVAKYLK